MSCVFTDFTRLIVCLGVLTSLPTVVDAVRFAVIGDWGTGGYKARSDWETRSAQMLNEVCGQLKCNFTISVGDNIYVGNVMQGLHDSFEEMFEPSSGPFFPVPGNHDNVGPQLEYAKTHPRWRFDNRFYKYKLPIDESGYAVEIFGVDTTDGSLSGGPQYHWLENGLHESTARWKFIFGHYPTTGSGRHKRIGSVNSLTGLMKKYNAQAYFFGHDHLVEVSNSEGRIYGLSGGMARGGMMYRGLGGSIRRFTLTTPNEYNQHRQDWSEHGFFIGDLSPNVLTLSTWFHQGGMQYEFSVTHDWQAQAMNGSAKQRDQWPPAEVILQAYKDEMNLPPGDEAADAMGWANGELQTKPAVVRTPAPPTTAAPVVNGTTGTAAPPPATTAHPLPPGQTLPLDKLMDNHSPEPHPLGQAMYAVSAECDRCRSGPAIGESFTITIQDYDIVGAQCRIFLSTSATGCFDPSKRFYLEGTGGIHPLHGNTFVTNNTAGSATPVYVCLSTDGGQTYERLRRVNDPNEPASFKLGFPDYTAAVSGPLQLRPAEAPLGANLGPTTTQVSPQASGHGLATVVAVGVAGMAAGLVLNVAVKRFQSR